jgi:drug/metabolite transporter (DMT)-like permease
MKIYLYTGFALVCFAFNSILCRLALGEALIDAPAFTAVRLISGALTLFFVNYVSNPRESRNEGGTWFSAFYLFAYAICFSFAYLGLTTATGALILFGSVQATMFLTAIVKGEHPGALEWLGLAVALGGLVYLVFPGLAAPPLTSSLLMAAAGAAWGFYTLRGLGSANPLAETAGNFLRSVPLVLLAALPFLGQIHLTAKGVLFAVLSGAVASGLGYSVWYSALKFHTAARAAVLQLAVPVLAAFGGVIFLAEMLSPRLMLASGLILGGIAVAIAGKRAVRKGDR